MPSNKQRREAARRKLERQLQTRHEQQRRRRRGNLIASIVGGVVVVGVVIAYLAVTSGEDHSSNSADGSSTPGSAAVTTTATTASAAALPAYPCTWTKTADAAARKATVPSTTRPARTGTVAVTATTTRGVITMQLDRAGGPCSVASVVSLAEQAYYNNSPCHRLVTSGIFVLQCGDPSGTGSGGPGYTVNDEATGKEKYPAGTIAMARTSDANSTGSQFFIVYKDSPDLAQQLGAKQYTVIGKVTSGLDVVQTVAAGGADTGTDGKPKLAVTITTMAVAK